MTEKLLIHSAAELVTCRGRGPKCGAAMNELDIIRDGAVVAENGVITDIGTTRDILSRHNASQYHAIDAAGKCVMPGLIDPHTHFVFAGYRPEEFAWRLAGKSYIEIMERGGGIVNTVRDTRAASHRELKSLAQARLAVMLEQGITTVEGKSGYGLDTATELRQLEVMAELNREQPVEIAATFLGAHAVPSEFSGRTDAFMDFLIAEVMPQVAQARLAEFCDVFCEKGVFSVAQSRRLLTAGLTMGLMPKLHADEIYPLGGAELAAELGAVSADHLLHASDAGIQAMASRKVTATLLPATAFSLRETYARAREMIDRGVAVALASDYNPGSCFSQSAPLVAALAALNMRMTPAEVISAMTINAAAAIHRADRLGSLEEGKQADILVLRHPSHLFLIYHTGMNCVETVIKKGVVVCTTKREVA